MQDFIKKADLSNIKGAFADKKLTLRDSAVS